MQALSSCSEGTTVNVHTRGKGAIVRCVHTRGGGAIVRCVHTRGGGAIVRCVHTRGGGAIVRCVHTHCTFHCTQSHPFITVPHCLLVNRTGTENSLKLQLK